MKKIKLTQGKYALVDNEDFFKLNQKKWCLHNKSYAVTWNKNKNPTLIHIHKMILKNPKGTFIDHIDGNGLNNQKSNLRICTHSENCKNRGKTKKNTSGYKGVYSTKNKNIWRSQIKVNNKLIFIGNFKNKEGAYKAYCEACIKYHKEFARLK